MLLGVEPALSCLMPPQFCKGGGGLIGAVQSDGQMGGGGVGDALREMEGLRRLSSFEEDLLQEQFREQPRPERRGEIDAGARPAR